MAGTSVAVSWSYIWPISKNLFNSQIISLDFDPWAGSGHLCAAELPTLPDRRLLSGLSPSKALHWCSFFPPWPSLLPQFPTGLCFLDAFLSLLVFTSNLLLSLKPRWEKKPSRSDHWQQVPHPQPSWLHLLNLRDKSHGLERQAEMFCSISKKKATPPFFCQWKMRGDNAAWKLF